MSKRKKLSKYEKQQRRLEEIRRANENPWRETAVWGTPQRVLQENPGAVSKRDHQIADLRFTLPVRDIKRDLVRNLLYLIFCVVVLSGLSLANPDLERFFSF